MGPLTGTRVVELEGIGPLPFASMLLAELGADVIRVERPGVEPLGIPRFADLARRGRPSIAVDLKDPRGIDLVRRLVGEADVFVEGFRPGVAERLGLGPGVLCADRPTLVYGRMTGWGQTGPLAERAGHDIDFVAVSGLLHAIGPADAPAVPVNVAGDLGGGAMYLVVGILAALLERHRSGRGQVIDAAIVDGAAHLGTAMHGLLAAGLWTDARESNLIDGGTPYYAVYETSDHGHLAIGPLEDRFYDEFVALLEPTLPLPDRDDRAAWPALRAAIAGRIAERPLAEWVEVFDGTDACVAPVLGLHDAPDHPHLAARETFVDMDGLTQPAPAPRFSRSTTFIAPASDSRATRIALRAWGISDVDTLVEAGVIGLPEDSTR